MPRDVDLSISKREIIINFYNLCIIICKKLSKKICFNVMRFDSIKLEWYDLITICNDTNARALQHSVLTDAVETCRNWDKHDLMAWTDSAHVEQ